MKAGITSPRYIEGGIHIDIRGVVRFVNDFDMSRVVRMYSIEPTENCIRAWQGHRLETKWFNVVRGSLKVITIRMEDNIRNEFYLSATQSQVLEIPPGHYNGFVSLNSDTLLIVYSDLSLMESINDDYRKSLEHFSW